MHNAEGKDLVILGATPGLEGTAITYNSEGKELVTLGSVAGNGRFDGTGMVTVHDPTSRFRRGVLGAQ